MKLELISLIFLINKKDNLPNEEKKTGFKSL